MSKFDYKSLSVEEMISCFEKGNFKVKPMWHQMVSLSFVLGEGLDRIAFWHDVGTGKTIVALYTVLVWDCSRILVICPTSAFGAWERDIKKATDFSYVFLTGSRQERLSKLKRKENVSIINYEGLKTIYAELRSLTDEDRRKWRINHSSFLDDFDCIVLDEIHKCQNYNSLQSKLCLELSRRSSYCIGLTGTPLDKNMLELFNICKVIDLGDSLGYNFFAYRHTYFKKGWFDWNLKPGCKERILNRLSNHTISFSREECFDLPEVQTIERPVKPSKEFLKLQDQIIEEEVIKIGECEVLVTAPATKGQKLLELSSGFLYYGDGEEKEQYFLQENPKLDALMDLIEDTKSKVVVVHKFIAEALLIEESLEKHGVGFVAIRGGLKIDRGKEIKKFIECSGIKVMLVHPTCASEGWDGSVANVMIFFSPIASPRIRRQCEGRIHRKGQKKKCVFIDLVLEQSIDSTVNRNRAMRKKLVDSTMEYIQGYKKNEK